MKRTLPLWALLFSLCAANANAQLYKWVGPDGKVTYTDSPPPASASAKRVETKSLGTGEVNTTGLPYELSEAVKGSPVTLYTTQNCAPCDDARKLLSARGVPFAERTVTSNEDIALFRKSIGDSQLPVLLVGRNKVRGFEPGGLNAALTAAGYPETSKLPKSYRNPPAEAAAPAPKPVASTQQQSPGANNENTAGRTTELPAAVGNAPPGFRF
jgi:glutaredoxin